MASSRSDTTLGLRDPQSLPEAIASEIIERIYKGEIKSGEQLRLGPLARSVGTSMMPVRHALHLLESLGVVVVRPRRGTYVREVTRQDAESTYQARLVIEPALLELALPNFPGSAAAGVAEAALDELIKSRDEGDLLAWREAHRRFHWSLYLASGSDWLLHAARGPFGNSERYRLAAGPSANSSDSHSQLFNACLAGAKGEARALQLLRKHLSATLEAVRPILVDAPTDTSDNSEGLEPIRTLGSVGLRARKAGT